jgi:dTDP-4-amino-4,6-dideoxygalactose transaminase
MPSAVSVTVASATDAILALKKHGVVAKYGMFPLHKLDSVKSRFQDIPEYPMAEQLGSQVITLPAHAGLRATDLQRIAAILDEGSNV